jgi:AcrR family transcriptional regulator
MTPRPRTIDDGAILEAAGRIISRHGPAKFTLADIGAEVGLSAAALVRRFGSKRGLMLALARGARDSVDACFVAVRQSHPSPLEAVLAAGTEMTRFVTSPDEMANHLAFLQTDLSDPDFYQVMLENSRRIIEGYRKLLDEAVTARELVPCDTRRLARAVDAMSGGSLIGWAVHRGGTAESWVRHDLNTLLEPYRVKGVRSRPHPKKRARLDTVSSIADSARPTDRPASRGMQAKRRPAGRRRRSRAQPRRG